MPFKVAVFCCCAVLQRKGKNKKRTILIKLKYQKRTVQYGERESVYINKMHSLIPSHHFSFLLISLSLRSFLPFLFLQNFTKHSIIQILPSSKLFVDVVLICENCLTSIKYAWFYMLLMHMQLGCLAFLRHMYHSRDSIRDCRSVILLFCSSTPIELLSIFLFFLSPSLSCSLSLSLSLSLSHLSLSQTSAHANIAIKPNKKGMKSIKPAPHQTVIVQMCILDLLRYLAANASCAVHLQTRAAAAVVGSLGSRNAPAPPTTDCILGAYDCLLHRQPGNWGREKNIHRNAHTPQTNSVVEWVTFAVSEDIIYRVLYG